MEYSGWRKTRVNWKNISYLQEGFRKTVIQFDEDHNLSRFVWRTAKQYGMRQLTLSDVQKLLNAADETLFILRGDEDGKREFIGDQRKPTWVMEISRKDMWVAMHTIEKTGYAESQLMDITVNGKEMQQRVWTLA